MTRLFDSLFQKEQAQTAVLPCCWVFLALLALVACCVVERTAATETTTTGFDNFPQVISSNTTNVQVRLPSVVRFGTLTLVMRCLRGEGSAVFLPSNSVTTNVASQGSVSVALCAQTPSNVESNMVFEIMDDRNRVLATNIFTIVDTNTIGFAAARVFARAAIPAVIRLDSNNPTSVVFNRLDGIYVVTFLTPQTDGVLAGDFRARVRIDAKTGVVTDGIEGPP